MSLYLCVFENDREIAGVEVGSYADFGALRDAVASHLEGGDPGSRFPVLMNHSDCEGDWPVDDLRRLRQELGEIIGAAAGPVPGGILTSFRDVDGEVLLLQLERLAVAALSVSQPILFQ